MIHLVTLILNLKMGTHVVLAYTRTKDNVRQQHMIIDMSHVVVDIHRRNVYRLLCV